MHYLWYVGGIIVNPDNSSSRMKVNYLCGNWLIGTSEWMGSEQPAELNLSTGAMRIYDHDPQGICQWFKGWDPGELKVKDVSQWMDTADLEEEALIVKGQTHATINSLIPVLARHQVAGTDVVKGLKARGLKNIPKFTRLHSGGWDIRYDASFAINWDGSTTLGGLNWELEYERKRLREAIDSLKDQPAEAEERSGS